jgi:TonB family protein
MNRLKEIWNDKDKRRGVLATFLVHLVLLFALFFLALRTPLPLPGEEGVEVNFGYDEQGYGDIQSESAPPESQPTPPPQQEQTQPQPEPEPVVEEEEIITQDIEEAPVIEEEIEEEQPEEIVEEPEEVIEEEKEPEKIEEVEEEPEEQPVDTTFVTETEEVVEEVVEEPKPVVNQRALYPGTSANKEGTNQGIKEGAGDMGKPQGYKESDKYDGRGGEGNGPSFYLGGRGSSYLEIPEMQVKERGTVVVDIWVNREGNVVKAQVKSKGTTVLDADQRQRAIQAARNSTFEADPQAEPEQRGTITYTFILLK